MAERRAETADRVVEPDTRFHQMAACGDDAAHPVRCRRFYVHLLVKAGSCQLCEAGGVVRVGLVCRHCLEALVRLTGIDAHHWDSQFT